MDAMVEIGALMDAEPGLRRQLSERELDSALEAVADFTDLRSPSRAGHSRGVAHLAVTAAGLCGLPEREIVTVRPWCTTSACTGCRHRSSTSPGR
jgi:HD-GYP domain-containing protein (c-di-GMP phosphodiesterase class II)